MTRRIAGAIVLLVAAGAGMTRAAEGPEQQAPAVNQGRFLGREEIRLYGMQLTVAPAKQVVPKDMATIVSAFLQTPTPPPGSSPVAFAPDAEVRATLRGPSLPQPLELAVRPGSAFAIPPLKIPGLHTLENIRLVSGGEVLLRGTPESAVIEVIDKLLVTQVTARPLTADEIREKGIVFDRSNFQAYNFTAAFAIQDTPIQVSFPVLLPRLLGAEAPTSPNVTIPGVPTPAIPQLSTIIPDTLKLQTRLPNLQVVGFSLKIPEVKNGNLIVPPIPGIIAIPGDIGFLNQYFSVMLMVGNAAPAGSGLVVSDLQAEILLPPGRDNVPQSGDDPLAMAMTDRGEAPRLQIVAQAGPDGKLGTADDIRTIGPGESGNAEYLVEGRREGTHIVEMRMTGTLNGLPAGPVQVTGSAMGSVLVRNPTFALTFTHPEVVSANETYTLDVTVTNTSESPANVVSLNLHQRDIGGAELVGEGSQAIDSIAPGDSATVSFTLRAKVTGRVIAATLDAEDGVSGRFGLKTTVGELGVPLSPDSLVLPQEARHVPKPLRDAAIGLLGKAWAVATAPASAVPSNLSRFSRKIVLDRAVEVAEAGLRIELQEPEADSAAQLALDMLGSNFPRLAERITDQESLAFEQNNYRGFDLLRRLSVRGDVFADAVAGQLAGRLASLGPKAFHRDLAEKISYRPAALSVLISSQNELPVRLALADAAGRSTGGEDAEGKVVKGIPFSDVLRFSNGAGALTSEMVLIGAPENGTFTVRLTRTPGVAADTPFMLSLIVPGAGGVLRQVVFTDLVAGEQPVLTFPDGAPYQVAVQWVDAAAPNQVTADDDTIVDDPAPSVISVIQRAAADQIVCEADQLIGPRPGRIIAVLFSEEVTPESVQDKLRPEAITNYAIDGNAVVGVALQPGRRIAYLALRDPFGPLVPRSLTINGVKDLRGNVITTQAMPIQATVDDPAGVVTGQVLRADGTPAAFANVRLFYRSPCNDLETSWIGISSKTADAEGRFAWDFVLTALPARIVAIDADTGDVRDVRFHVRSLGQHLNVNIVFLGRGTLTGRTVDAAGAPLVDTFVRVTSLTDQTQYSGRTDAQGRYTITGVPVGNIIIDAVNTTSNARTTESELIPFAGATTTRDLVLYDATTEPITIKRGTITGYVLESDGRRPAAGLPVIAFYQSMSQQGIACPKGAGECPVAVTTTNNLGFFSLPDVVAGALRLQTFNQGSFEQGQVGVVLAPNQTLSANIVLNGGLGTVRGIVLDPSGNPVAGAQVGGGLSLTTTDSDGRFELNDVPVGRREIVAVSSTIGARARVLVDVLYTGHEVNATLVLDAVGSVSGVVTRANGAPAVGLPVYVIQKQGETVQVLGTATTDDDGGYRIDRIPLGAYSVSVFTSDFSDGNIVPAVLKFHGQVVRADVKFRGGGGKVSGTVFADDKQTPLRARVSVSGEQVVVAGGVVGVEFRRIENFRIVDTNLTTGRYSISGLFVGPFTVRAAGAFSPDPVTAEAVMPAPGQEVEVNLFLQPTTQLTGTVFMPDGTTPVGANVAVHFKSDAVKTICTETSVGETICESFPQGVQSADVVTGDDGSYLFPLLNAGKYTLTVDGPGGRTAVVKGTLAAGQPGRHDVRLLGRSDVTVRVRAADAKTPIPGARVDVTQVGEPRKKLSYEADDQGVITFSGLDAFAEGEIVVMATDLRNGATGRARARLGADEAPETVDVFLDTSSGVVYGRVLNPVGQPVPNAEVVITRNGNPLAFAITDSEGRYREIGIPLGEVRVEVFEAATGRRGSTAGHLATNGAEIELNVVQEALGVVRGQVLAAVTLQPLRNWRVTLGGTTPSGRSMPALVTTTGLDGGFSFPGTPLGRFTIVATKPGEPGSGTAQGTIVREGQLVTLPVIATIPRQPEATIDGTVVDHLGAPVPNARVEVRKPGASLPTVITADGSGHFTFGPTILGRHVLRASRQGSSDSGMSAVDVSFDGQVAATSIVLNGLSTVSGIVMHNGKPVPGAPVEIEGQPASGCGGTCSGFAGPDGSFTFEQISARSFTVTASDTNGVLHGSTSALLNPGETKTITVTLETTRRMTGRVLNADGEPVAGVVGEVVIGQRRFFAESNADGLFEYKALPIGDYRLELRDATGPGMAARRGTIVNDVSLGDVTLDAAPPRVLSVTPLPSTVAVPRGQAVTLLFSEPVDRGSVDVDSVTLTGPNGDVLLDLPAFQANDTEVVLQPTTELAAETTYTLRVAGVTDRHGRALAEPFSSTFTTVDVTPPAVAEASPAAGANGVSAFTTIRIKFSEPVLPEEFDEPVFEVTQGSNAVEGRVDFILGNTVAVFTPNVPLDEDSAYRVRMSPAVDLSGNQMAQGLDYVFTTTDRTPPQVALVAAGDGTVIAGATTQVDAVLPATHDVKSVDFYLNGQLAFSDTLEPFTLTLQAVPALGGPGASIKVSAIATDTSGNRTPAPGAEIFVLIKPDEMPAAALLAPAAGASVPNGSVLTIRVRSTDDVNVAKVGYRITSGGNVNAAAVDVNPASKDVTHQFEYQVPPTAAPGAILRIEPTAIDSTGQAVAGSAIEVRVLDAAPPDVEITGVTSGAEVRPGQSTTVVVAAEDAGLVRTVTFTASGAASFTQTRTIDPAQPNVAASFTFTVPPSAKATESVTLSAFAVDAAGNRADAAAIVLPVADLVAPTVSLSSGSLEMVPGSPLEVVAVGNDAVGVERIELTGTGAFTVAEGRTFDPPESTATATFTILVPDTVPPGATLQLQARARDKAQNISTPATITVTAVGAVEVILPDSIIVNAGETASIAVKLGAEPDASVRVDLATENEAIATVTTPVIFNAGETEKQATVTAHAGGSTALIASINGVERAQMTVTVQGGIVTGTVYNPDMQPVAGALVTVEGGAKVTTESGPDGKFTVQGIAGPFVRVRALDDDSGLYGVSQGTMATNGFLELDVVLIDAGSVHGVVRRADGQPAGPNVQVGIFTLNGQEPEQVVFTGPNGEYEFPLVAVGSYRIDASSADGNRGRTTVTVAGGEQLEKDVRFLARGSVRAIVVDAFEQPVEGVGLKLRSTSIFGATEVTATSGDGGAFTFTDVFAGDFTIDAEREGTGEGGRATGKLVDDGSTVEATIKLSPVGSLEGVVLRADHSPVSGAEVRVGTRTATTDDAGEYHFAFLPAGAFTATAKVEGTREVGQATGTIVAGQTAKAEIELLPQGRVEVTVLDADGHPVGGAAVTVSVSSGSLSDLISGTTAHGTGTVLIDHVMAASFTVTASFNGASTSENGTLLPGETRRITLSLQPTASITGTVYLPGGELRASGGKVYLDTGNVPVQPDGTYEFPDVRAGRTYTMTVYDAQSIRRASAIVVVPATGGNVVRDFELVGVGTVKGRVLNGTNGVANMKVRVESEHPAFGNSVTATTNAAGFYEAPNVVFGAILASAGSGSLRGEATGTLDRADVPLTLDILLTNNATTLPASLYDANGSRFDMQMDGGLGTASDGFYNAFHLDVIAGGQPVRFEGEGVPTIENGGREIATRQNGLAGLNVTRKLFVPSTGYFGRWIEILSNPTQDPITVDVHLSSIVGTNRSAHPVTSVVATSSGDDVLDVSSDTPDRWLVVDDATDVEPTTSTTGVPAVAFVFDGPGADVSAGEATHTVDPLSTTEKNHVAYTWQNITIPAGESVALMHFGVRQMGRAQAALSAERLVQLPPEALAGLDPDEIPIVANFDVPADGNSALAPLPPVNGAVSGRVLAGDGETPVPSVSVKFKSSSPFYGRTYTLSNTNATGAFSLASVVGNSTPVAISMGDEFTLTAQHPDTKVNAPPVSASVAEGEQTATADVVFVGTGIVRGSVRRHNGTLVTTGPLTLAYPGGKLSRQLNGSSSFVFTGLPEGSATLDITHVPAAGGTLKGTQAYSIVAGAAAEHDLFIEPTGSITGTVLTASGGAAVKASVSLTRTGYTNSRTTDTGGEYTFTDVPLGAFTVTAKDTAVGVETSAPAVVAQDATTPMPPLTLIGTGTIQLQVKYGSNENVDRTVSVQSFESGRTGVRGFNTNTSGQLTITNVTEGPFTLKAFHPLNTSYFAEVSGVMVHGQKLPVTITLPKLGSVTAHVRFPGNVAPGSVPVEIRGEVTDSRNTNTQGDVTFTHVEGDKTFTVRAFTASNKQFYRDSAPQAITLDGQGVTVDLTLPAVASTLAVEVRQGLQPASGARVAIKHAFATAFTSPISVNSNGIANYSSVPEGPVQIRVTTSSGALLAEAEAVITPDDHAKPVHVTVQAGIPLPRTLTDANGFAFDISATGITIKGTEKSEGSLKHKAYDSGLELRLMAGGTALTFDGNVVAALEANGRELVITNDTDEDPAGLQVTRKIFVPDTGYFARYLELLHNPTNEAIIVDVEVSSDLDSEEATLIVDQNAGEWIVTDDDAGNDAWPSSDQALAHVFAKTNGDLPLPAVTLPSAAADTLAYRWASVTIQPQQTVALMHFAVQQPTHAAAQASAVRLAQLPPEALVDLTAEEIAAIANFEVPADGVGTVAPLVVAPSFTVSGEIFTWNGTTPTNPKNTVTLRSSNPIYSKTVTATVGTSFSLTGTVADGWSLETSNQPPPPFDGWQTSRMQTGTLVPGQTSAVENVIFEGTGSISGRVHFTDNSAPGTGSLVFSLAPTSSVFVGGLPNGSFTLPVIPPGQYTMTATVNNRQALATFTVAPGADTPVDLRIPAVATVSVQVNNPNGSPAASPEVRLAYPGKVITSTASPAGVVTFNGVPEGPFTVIAVENHGFGPRSGTAEGQVLASNDGGTVGAEVTLNALVTVRVLVTRGGDPVPFTPVEVRRSGSLFFQFAGMTDANGILLVEDVPAGTFDVQVRAGAANVVAGRASATIPQTADGQTIDVPVVLSTDLVSISGTVYASDGETRVRNYSADVRVFDGDVEVAVVPVIDGLYLVPDVPRPAGGTLQLRVHYPSGQNRHVEIAVPVATGTAVTQDVTLPIGAIKGRLTLWDGSVPPGGDIYVQGVDDYELGVSIDENGWYAVFDVPAGDYLLTAYAYNGAFAMIAGNVAGAGEVVTRHVTIGRVRGQMTYADGQPAQGAVFVTQEIRPGLEVTYDAQFVAADGSYEVIGPPPGEVTVVAQKLMLEGRVDTQLPSVGPDVVVNVQLEPDGVVSGVVRDAVGTPIPGAEVTLSIDGLMRSTSADGNGEFRFERVKRGVFWVHARVGGGSSAQYASAGGVLTDQPASGIVVVQLPPLGVVTGSVLLNGQPASGAEVIVENRDHAGPLGWFTRTVSADASGAFSVADVPAGELRVSAFDGVFGGWTTVTLSPDEPASVEIHIGALVKVSPPYALGSGGMNFDVTCEGRIARGATTSGVDSYNQAFMLSVAGMAFPCQAAAALEDNGRELVLDGGTMAGLQVTRKIYVPQAGGFARYLEVIRNTSPVARTFRVRIDGAFGTFMIPRSYVDPEDTGRTYGVVSMFTVEKSLGFAFAGQGAPVGVASVLAAWDQVFYYEWEVTVPAGETVILMHFAQQGGHPQLTRDDTEGLATLSRAEALQGMSVEEKARVVNFVVP